jgi:sulfatase modifying factor 1
MGNWVHHSIPVAVVSTLTLLLTACGSDTTPTPVEMPEWARVAPEQIAEAKKYGVPVAFENDLGMRLVLIPAGTFLMGSPEDEEGRGDDETQHEVTITKPFYMSIFEVTNGQYRKFKSAHDSGEYRGYSRSGDRQPVVKVTWEDVTAFANWLSPRAGKSTWTLPTEAQWEYACRAGTTTAFAFGTSITTDDANFRDRQHSGDDSRHVASDIGTFRPNAWGLYDMHGNAEEWCASIYRTYPSSAVTDPPSDYAGEYEFLPIIRGGSFEQEMRYVRSAARSHLLYGRRAPCLGFRLVAPLPEKEQ